MAAEQTTTSTATSDGAANAPAVTSTAAAREVLDRRLQATSEGIENDGTEAPLLVEFVRARELLAEMERAPDSRAPDYQAKARQCVELFLRCYVRVETLHLYSANEHVDELTTAGLRYLLIPYHIAKATLNVQGGADSELQRNKDRVEKLMEATEYLDRFILRCEQYKVIDAKDVKALRGQLPNTAAAKLDDKKERHQRNKAGKQRLEALQKDLAKRVAQKGEGAEDDRLDDDEEREREILRLELDLATRASVEDRNSLAAEVTMLRQIIAMMEANGGQAPRPPAAAEERRAPMPPMHITQRDILRAQVFRDPNAPLMTLDEFYELQHKNGAFLSGGGAEGEAREAKKKEDALYNETEADSDAATMKARNWDDWKDDNPRGSGNTMGNIG